MAQYIFPCILTPENDCGYSVDFPDVPQCFTCGNDLSHALEMAHDVLQLRLHDIEADGLPLPAPSDPRSLKTADGETVVLVSCDTSGLT